MRAYDGGGSGASACATRLCAASHIFGSYSATSPAHYAERALVTDIRDRCPGPDVQPPRNSVMPAQPVDHKGMRARFRAMFSPAPCLQRRQTANGRAARTSFARRRGRRGRPRCGQSLWRTAKLGALMSPLFCRRSSVPRTHANHPASALRCRRSAHMCGRAACGRCAGAGKYKAEGGPSLLAFGSPLTTAHHLLRVLGQNEAFCDVLGPRGAPPAGARPVPRVGPVRWHWLDGRDDLRGRDCLHRPQLVLLPVPAWKRTSRSAVPASIRG